MGWDGVGWGCLPMPSVKRRGGQNPLNLIPKAPNAFVLLGTFGGRTLDEATQCSKDFKQRSEHYINQTSGAMQCL